MFSSTLSTFFEKSFYDNVFHWVKQPIASKNQVRVLFFHFNGPYATVSVNDAAYM